MRITERGLALIRAFEGQSLVPYLCPANYWTIDRGSVWGLQGERVTAHTPPITAEQSELLFVRNVEQTDRAVSRLIHVPCTSPQWDALVSFTFNLGSGSLQRSRLRALVNREEHDDVPAEFLKWVWAGGRKLAGLVRRRAAEAQLYQNG